MFQFNSTEDLQEYQLCCWNVASCTKISHFGFFGLKYHIILRGSKSWSWAVRWIRIWIRILWSSPFLAGSGSTEPGDNMFLMNSWWNLRAFRLLNFENPSRGSKVRDFLSWGPIFGQKNQIFGGYDNVTLIFDDGIDQKLFFFDKKWPTLMAYNFWTGGRIFKLQKSKLVRILSPIHWNHQNQCFIQIQICPNQQDMDPDPYFKIEILHTAYFFWH